VPLDQLPAFANECRLMLDKKFDHQKSSPSGAYTIVDSIPISLLFCSLCLERTGIPG